MLHPLYVMECHLYLRIIAGVFFSHVQASLAIIAITDVLPDPDSPCSTRGSLLIPSI